VVFSLLWELVSRTIKKWMFYKYQNGLWINCLRLNLDAALHDIWSQDYCKSLSSIVATVKPNNR
jgi:hypothetical protein